MGELNIKKAMKTKNVSVEAIAGLLGIHRNSASNKVNGETAFTIQEGFQLKSNLFSEYDINYLFSSETDDQAS